MAAVIVPQHPVWKRDPGIRELIRYFNQPKFTEPPDPRQALGKNDRLLMAEEIRKCQEGFRYAARNYFWIIDEHGQDVLLKLLESQELILEKIEWLRSQGKPQKVMILKARRLGASTLVEALIAWKTMFFYNSTALVLADNRDLAKLLFAIMLNIYDKMPWWLKPDYTNKTYDGGLVFQNPDEKDRARNPGLNSKIVVQVAGGQSGVAQGYRISAAHISEYSSYEEWRAKEIIEGDLSYSLANNVGTIAALESTGKGSGTYAEKLWNANVKLAERAEWLPIFLPTFFEKSRVLMPPKEWRAQQPEEDIRQIAANEWVKCDNLNCIQYRESLFQGQRLFDTLCPTCRAGTLRAVQLTDAQLYYMENQRINKEAKGDEAIRELKQELCVAGDTRVSTEGGIVTIDSARSATSVESGRVSGWYERGERAVVKVTTVMGRELTCTPDHRIGTVEDRWVEAQCLKPGDKVVLAPPMLSYCSYTAKWEYTPACMMSVGITEDWGRFLGYWMGDGCWRGCGVQIACDAKDEDVRDDIARLLERLTGRPPIITTRGKMYLIESNDKRWFEILRGLKVIEHWRNSKNGYKRKVCVPESIWRSPQPVVRQFLSALFECDGHAYRKAPRTVFFTKWAELARDVQLLLLGFGVNGQIYHEHRTKQDPDGTTRTYQGYNLRLKVVASNVFHEKVGFISQRKRGGCVRPASTKYRKSFFANRMEDTVLSVTEAGSASVFDFGVHDSHRFGANGLLVHNCVTAQDAWQLSGYPVFPRAAIEWVTMTSTERPISEGYLDSKCRFHGVDMRRVKPEHGYYPCISKDCDQNHHFDPDDQKRLKIWEEPQDDERYAIGGDPADGLGGEADSSVGWVNRLGKTPQDGDVHVATFASNTIDPEDFAVVLVRMGKYFNEAMLAIEYNKEATGNTVRNYYQYPNLFRWKHYDNVRMESNKYHWLTTYRTKPLLEGHAVRWLKSRLWTIRDPEFLVEMKKYQKLDYEDRGGKAEYGAHDDRILAGMIALFCAHDQDWDPDTQTIPLPRGATKEAGDWLATCDACHAETECANPKALSVCPGCGSLKLRFRRKLPALNTITLDFTGAEADFGLPGPGSPQTSDSTTLVRYNDYG